MANDRNACSDISSDGTKSVSCVAEAVPACPMAAVAAGGKEVPCCGPSCSDGEYADVEVKCNIAPEAAAHAFEVASVLERGEYSARPRTVEGLAARHDRTQCGQVGGDAVLAETNAAQRASSVDQECTASALPTAFHGQGAFH